MKTPKNSAPPLLRNRLLFKLFILALGIVLPAMASRAQTGWIGTTGDFNTPASWNGTYIDVGTSSPNPNCTDDAGSNNVVLIQAGDAIWYHGDTLAGNGGNTSGAYLQTGSTNNTGFPSNGNWLRMGIAGGTFGSYTLSNGTVNVAGRTQLGENGAGLLVVDGGVYNTGFNGNPGIVAGQGDFGTSTGTLILNAGVVSNVLNETWFGEALPGCYGYLYMNGGTFNVNNWFVFGRNGGNGFGVMTGGTLNFYGNGQFLVGGGGVGSLTQSGGIINVHNQYLVPQSNGSGTGTGTNNLSGTAALNVFSWLAVGRNSGYGEMNISGNATVTRNDGGSHFDIGAGGPGVVNQNGGTITDHSNPVWLGETATATWNLNSGSALVNNIIMSVNNSSTSTLNLNGGLLQVTSITSPSSATIETLNLNGGLLQANANSSTFINGIFQTLISAGGAIIDCQSFNLTVPEALQDNNGGLATLAKLGTGSLVLSGANSFGGPVTVNGGLLEISTAGSALGSITASNTAGFGTLVSSGNGQLNVASLTLGGATGGSLMFDLGAFGNPTVAPLNIVGAYKASGTITVNIGASVLAVGTFPLAQYNNLVGSPTYVTGTLPPGVVAHVTTAGNTLELVVTSAAAPRWNGNVLGAWDLGTNQDWFDLGTLLPTTYHDGNPVVFDDNASGTTTVNLTATVSPSSINFNNSSLPYTIVGTGKISGTTGLNINDPGMVAIQNTGGNNFTGPVLISNGGILSVTNISNGGTAGPLGASSASPTNLIINTATFTYNGAPAKANRGLEIAGTNSIVDAEDNLTLSGNVAALLNAIEGGSAFVKTGPAQLAFTGSGANEFSANYNPGVNIKAGTVLLDGSAGGQTNHTQNEMWIGSTPDSGAALILTNTTLNVDSWVGLGRINGDANNTSSITMYNSALKIGNLSLGWDGGQPNNLSSQFLTLYGNSTLTNYGAVNLPEGVGSSMTLSLHGNSVFWVQNEIDMCKASDTTGAVYVADSAEIVQQSSPTYLGLGDSSQSTLVLANSSQFVQLNDWFDIGQGNNCTATVLAKDNSSLTLAGDFNVSDTANGATATAILQDNATLHANNLWVGKATGVTATFNITNNATVVSANGLTMATRYDGTPEVCTATLNLAGGSLAVNLVQGNNVAGVYYGVFNFGGGKLISKPTGGYSGENFMYNLAAINVLAGGAIIEIDTNVNQIAQPLLGFGADGGLTKLGAGTLCLDSVNTYTNTTQVAGGMLAGTGTIPGSVKVSSGAALGAGDGGIGSLTINGALSFVAGSQAFIKLTPSSNDEIQGMTTVSYAGALVITNTSGTPLTPGNVYQIFSAAAPGTGNFSSVTVLPSGSATFNPATGLLTIGANAAPKVNPPVISGGSLSFSGTGGTPGNGYTVLSTTNLTTPVAAWITNATGVFDGTGAFSNSIPVSSTTPAQFFLLRTP